MARTLAEILTTLDEAQTAQAGLSGLSSTSQTSIFKLWKYIVGLSMYLHEVLIDLKKAEIETIVLSAQAGTAPWLRKKAFEFQYDATTPQIVALDANYIPAYPVIDVSKRIITSCTLSATIGVAYMAAGKGSPPAKLSALELTALNAYFNDAGSSAALGLGVGFMGTQLNVNSYDPDLVYLEATIYYNGLYSAVISANVILAIETFLSNLPVTGILKTIDLVDAIQAVEGVANINIVNLAIRYATVAFASKVHLITASATNLVELQTIAGYAIGETTALSTLTDKLTFTQV